MNLSDVGPVAFFWGTIFALGAHSRLGAQKLPSMRILPSHSGKDQKKRTKVFLENAPQWHRSCCFLLGHDFCLGETLSLEGTKTFVGKDFALTFGGKD